MSSLLEQLEINNTFFVQFAIFAVLFLFLSNLYFKPFLRLFEMRHRKTVADAEAAERLMVQADAKFEEYKSRLAQERLAARKEFEDALSEAKKEESAILSHAREEAKKITQAAAESVAQQREQLRKGLEADVESMARAISEKLLSRKV